MCARSTVSSSPNEAAVTEKIVKQVEETMKAQMEAAMKAQMEAAVAKLNQKWALKLQKNQRHTKSLKKCLDDIYQKANLDPPEAFYEVQNEDEDVIDSDSDDEYQNVDCEGDSDDDN